MMVAGIAESIRILPLCICTAYTQKKEGNGNLESPDRHLANGTRKVHSTDASKGSLLARLLQ